MDNLISRQTAIDSLNDEVTITGKTNAIVFMDYVRRVNRRLEQIPAVDAVPVIRCKDCKHYNAGFECLIEGYGIERDKDWYCGDGERREEDGRKGD